MINSISKMIRQLWIPILLPGIVFFTFITALIHGINIDKFSFANIYIDRFYIKLDKKLIVDINSLTLPKSSSSNSAREELVTLLSYLPWLDRLFESISIGKIIYENETISFLFKKDIFYLDSNYMTIDAAIKSIDGEIKTQIKQLLVKDFNLELRGILDFDILNEEGFFEGEFSTYEIEGKIVLRLKDRMLSYVAKSDRFSSLDSFMEALESIVEIEPEISDWIYKKITSSSYLLKSLKGKIDLKNGEYFPYEMEGEAFAKDVKVKFEEHLPAANIEELSIKLKNNQLLFDLGKSSYEGIDISGSDVYIYNLLKGKAGIVVIIDANTRLDERVHQILNAYDIKIPLTQLSGKTKAKLKLDIEFSPFHIDTHGFFIPQNSQFAFLDEVFYTKHSFITLKNSDIYLDNTHLSYGSLFELYTQGTLDLEELNYMGNVDLEFLNIKSEDETIIELEKYLTPIVVDFKEEATITLPELNSKIAFLQEGFSFRANDLKLIYPYAPILHEFEIKSGKVKGKTEDYKKYEIELLASSLKTPFYKDGKPLQSLLANIVNEGEKTDIKADGIKISKSKNSLNIVLENIDLKSESDESLNLNVDSFLNLEAKNSSIILNEDGKSFDFSKYSASLQKDNLTFNGSFKNSGFINFKKNSSGFTASIKELNDLSFKELLGKNLFNEGEFNIEIKGHNSNFYSGKLDLKDTYLVEMKAYNNLIALLNTVPSLALFKSPGFDEKGYKIGSGDIVFSMKDDILTLHLIELKGVSADILGKGVVNLKDGLLQVDLKLKTLKDISSFIGKIPLINHIFLGEDNSISTAIKISGNLEDPKVETEVFQDVVMTPLNILKRTLELPFKIFSD